MTDRTDGATRYFPDVVDRIVDPWRDGAPVGRVVVLAGTPQSGRSTVLSQITADLRDAGVRVVRRAANGGTMQSVDDGGPGEHVVQGSKVLAAALQVAGVGAVGDLIALVAEIATTHLMVDGLDPQRLPSDPYVHVNRLAEAVRERAELEPLALVIDDADKLDTPEVWWDALFGSGLPRSAARLPVLVVLGVERTSTAASHALEVVDKRLLPADLAEEVRLPALDPARIVRALGPVDDALLGQLRSLVQGRPAWLDEIWTTWRDRGAVVRRDGRWTVAPDARDRIRTSLHGWVESALHAGAPDGDGFWRAKEILETGALEGQRFTVEALADVLGADDVDELIDWMDEHLADPDGPALVEDDGFVARAEGVEPPELRCYRFRSAMVAGVLRQETLAAPNGKELARRYAHALARAYQHSSVSDIAWTISRLARTADDRELEEYVWRRANRLEGVEAAARLARFLIDDFDVEETPLEELAATVERLNVLTYRLLGAWDVAETLAFCTAAERAARVVWASERGATAGSRGSGLLITALHRLGRVAMSAGLHDESMAVHQEAATMSAAAGNHLYTAWLFQGLANAAFLSDRGDPVRLVDARRHVVEALGYARRVDSRAALLTQVGCLTMSAMIAGGLNDTDGRVGAIGEAVTLVLGPSFRGELVANGEMIADCTTRAGEVAVDRGDLDRAERFYAAATRCDAVADQYVLALNQLSYVRERRDDVMGAVQAASRALRLAVSFFVEDEGEALLRLAYCAPAGNASSAGPLALLAAGRISENRSELVVELRDDFGGLISTIDEPTRRRIERDYRADRGATLLREAFGLDVAEIDALNERLGDATEDDLRGFLLDVQRYCTR